MAGLSTRHLLETEDLTIEDIEQVLTVSRSFEEVNARAIKKLPTLRGRTIINLFLEPSTRTRTSFEIAAKRLSADAVNMTASASATVKGESLLDTAETLSAMACDLIVVRHAFSGAPHILAKHMQGSVVNGGDGLHQHPTQTLLDIYTMVDSLEELQGKKIGIVGDIVHSRVAGSLAPTLKRLGADPIFIAPPTMLPARPEVLGAQVSHSLDECLPELDVLYLLRIQAERTDVMGFPTLREYSNLFGLNARRGKALSPHAKIMHPGPMNRGVEISADMTSDPRCRVLNQVNAGVAIRMALMYLLLGGEE